MNKSLILNAAARCMAPDQYEKFESLISTGDLGERFSRCISKVVIADTAGVKPCATLHDDGYWTWKGTEPYEARFAGWRMDVYAHPSAEIAALRERIEGMEKDAEDAERKGIDRALDVLAANFYWSAYERVRDLVEKQP